MPHLPWAIGSLLAATAATAEPAAQPPPQQPPPTETTPADALAPARSAPARDSIAALHRRGESHFRLGHFRESVADFDREIALDPAREPYHWQRGLSLYYAGDYARGAKQFELHQTVNPHDVENAAWHYLCVAKDKGVAAAQKSLIPIPPGSDTRVPMAEIYALYAGRSRPEQVLAAARAGDPSEAELKQRLMYAHLYVGLWFSCGAGVPPAKPEEGKKAGETPAPQAQAKEKEHITVAAEKYAGDDYMSDVARVHAATFSTHPKPE
jgi:lipoprotein NlpI